MIERGTDAEDRLKYFGIIHGDFCGTQVRCDGKFERDLFSEAWESLPEQIRLRRYRPMLRKVRQQLAD